MTELEPGGARRLRARWVLTGELVLATAAHLGGGEEGPADLNVIRDRVTDRPLLTGASLAGALRGHLCDRTHAYHAEEKDPSIARLFGARRADDSGSQSAVICFDNLGAVPGGRLEIRDGVGIDDATGTAVGHAKWDLELLPAGTTFPLRVELLVDERADEAALVSSLVAALEGLQPGGIALGARRSRGFGQISSRAWRAYRYDLGTASGWLDWLFSDPLAPIPDGVAACDGPAASCAADAPDGLEVAAGPDGRRRFIIEVPLKIDRGLLVRSPAATVDAPDAAHLMSAGKGVLPGTSLAGTLRARALRILDALGDPDPAGFVDTLFGLTAHASRLRVGESTVTGGERLRQARIRIDRATQGVIKGGLFDEEPQVGGQVSVRLELRDPRPGETGLLLLLVKDLISGDLPVGGAAAVGRGVLAGEVTADDPDAAITELAATVEERRRDATARLRDRASA